MRAYLRMARVDHWQKNLLALPGAALAISVFPEAWRAANPWVLLAAAAALCITSSSNYVLNEVADRRDDRHHPSKRFRPAAQGEIRITPALLLWLGLGGIGIAAGWWVNAATGSSLLALLGMGLLYNLPPVRLKDRAHLDVLSESLNNPIRLLVGWFALGVTPWPPLSLLLGYWMLGGFLMAIKRLAELRAIDDAERAAAYRRSFRYYTADRLLVAIIFYATAFGLFAGMFVVRYRLELALGIPLMAGFMAFYLRLGFLPDSPTQYPERLYKQAGFIAYTALVFVALLLLLFADLPLLAELLRPSIPPAALP